MVAGGTMGGDTTAGADRMIGSWAFAVVRPSPDPQAVPRAPWRV